MAISTKSLSDWRQQLCEMPVDTRLTIRFQRDGKTTAATLILTDRMPAAAKNMAGESAANIKL